MRHLCAWLSIAAVTFVSGCAGNGSSTTSPSVTAAPAAVTRVIGLNGNLGFGIVQVGSTVTNTLTISNSGSSVLTISAVNVTGDLSSIVTTSFTGGTIAAGGSQQVSLRFAPTAAQSYTGTLTVSGDQTSGTNSAPVTGAGSAPAPAPVTTFTLGGVVNDGTTGPSGRIPSSTVVVNEGGNAGKSAVADASGNYTIAGLVAGVFSVSASHADYQTVTKTVSVSANATADFSLTRIASAPTPTPTPTPAPTPTPTPAPTPTPTPTPTPAPLGQPGLPSRTQVTPTIFRCSLDAIVHPASCINNSFGNATAICDDGARSCSSNNSGTCSSHTGVYCFVCPGDLCPQ